MTPWLFWLGLLGIPGGNPATPRIWLEIATGQTPARARGIADAFQKDRHLGNRVLQVLIVDPRTGFDGQDTRVWVGPFFRRLDAFSSGLALLESRQLEVFSLRRIDGSPVSLQLPGPARKRLKLSGVQAPWPQLGVALGPQVAGFSSPSARMPPLSSAVARLGYRDEVWIQGEAESCEEEHCRRWFHAVTPSPHRLAWFPAGHVVPVGVIRSQKNPEGKLERYTVALRVGSREGQASGMAMIFLGGRRPLRWFFRRKGFTGGRMIRQENGSWGVSSAVGMIGLSTGPDWLPVESLFRSTGRRQFF